MSTGVNPLAGKMPDLRESSMTPEEQRQADDLLERNLRDRGFDVEELWWLFGGRRLAQEGA